MNNQLQSPISVQARFMATLRGELLGREPGIALFGFFFLVIFAVPLILDIFNPSWWLKTLSGSGLAGIFFLFFYWIRQNGRQKENIPPTTVETTGVPMIAPLTDMKQTKLSIALLKTVLENRDPLVPPHGELTLV